MNGRPWRYADLNAIAALEADNFSDPWNHRMLADSFLAGSFYGSLLEEEGGITAYGAVSVAADEAEIPLICTAEMYRRCGRGAKILEDLLSIAREKGAERVFLEVRVSNAPAMSMYLKYGFCGAYARLRYYPDGEDALVMRKELD